MSMPILFMTQFTNIVFYDGECGLCQRSISLISKWDKNHMLNFAPLNGITFKKYFSETSDMKTVVFFSEGKLYTKSDAIIAIGKTLGGLKKSWIVLKFIPRLIRDAVYSFIAGHRNKVSCVILNKDKRFLN